MRPRQRHRRPGIALIMTLMIVLLMSTFLAEFIFSSGVDLRGIHNMRASLQARNLARSAFRALEIGLRMDEVDFFAGYRELEPLLALGAVPFEDGFLVGLEVQPLEGLYNVNELDFRQGTPQDSTRWQYFYNVMSVLTLPATNPDQAPETLRDEDIAAVYAAIVDWVDADEVNYTSLSGYTGAEQADYLLHEPELAVKNGLLDRLDELRVIRGVADMGLPWETWRSVFTATPKRSPASSDWPFAEQVNVNTATRLEMVQFLESMHLQAPTGTSVFSDAIQDINAYADRAEEVVRWLVPDDAPRPIYTKNSLVDRIQVLQGLNAKRADLVFTTIGRLYRIRIITEYGGVQARLNAVVQANRDSKTRTASSVEVLHVSLR
jgi:hypothetical protein